MYKQELRLAYEIGSKTFCRWLKPCLPKFIELGYKPQDKYLTPTMVRVFVAHHDEPAIITPKLAAILQNKPVKSRQKQTKEVAS